MKKKEIYSYLIDFAPLIFLLIIIIPVAIWINPQLISRFLGQTSHISQYGYLDLEHYIDIAQGLKKESYMTAFFPLWPFLIRQFNHSFNLDIYKTSIFASSIFGIIAFIVSRYVISNLTSKKFIISTTWALYVLSPMTVFFFAGYTEPIFALQSWIFFLCIIRLFSSPEQDNLSFLAFSIVLLFISIGLALTRPILIQTIFSTFATISSLLIFRNRQLQRYLLRVINISFIILLGTIIGYSIYGSILTNEGFRFFEPFYAQEVWNKSFGIRPIYLLTSRSSLIDLWGLYYPLILYASYLSCLRVKFKSLLILPFYNLPLTLLYPPIGILWGAFSKKIVPSKSESNLQRETTILNDLGYLEFIFLYAMFFSISHSSICFLTQPDYMRSLGRYIFGQPYFYVALSIYLENFTINHVNHKKVTIFASLLISCLYLLKNFVEFGSARLSP